MQTARHLVGILVELSAGMELGHDDLGRRNAFLGMDAYGNAAAVVGHGAGAVGFERHGHMGRVAGKRLVDRIVHDLVDHVMEAGAVVRVADIHAGPLAHGVQPPQHLDLVGAVGGRGRTGGVVILNVRHEIHFSGARPRRDIVTAARDSQADPM